MSEDSPDPIDVAIGDRMKVRRRQKGLSQTELGVALEVSFQQVQKYERGTNRMGGSTLVRAAKALDMPVSMLIGEMEPSQEDQDLLVGLRTSGAVEMLTAFATIEDGETRRALVAIVKATAALRAKQGLKGADQG
jgi:transcriptional regulator with XRE-family HTH domain